MQAYRKGYPKRRVGLTLSEQEYEEFAAIAEKEDLGIATVIKNMALAFHQSRPFISSGIEDQLKEFNFLVRNIANNVNQVAHKANMGEQVNVNEMLAYIKQLGAVVQEHTHSKVKGD